LEDQLELARLQQSLLGELRRLPGTQPLGPDEVRVLENECRELEEALVMPNYLFRLTKKYTLWEMALKLIDVCDTNQSDTRIAVEGLWRNIIYNALPVAPKGKLLSSLRSANIALKVLARKGHADVGNRDGEAEDLLDRFIEKPEGPFRFIIQLLRVGDCGTSTTAFPLRFVCRELEQVEACVDKDKEGEVTITNRTWRVLVAAGVSYYELFKVYLDILSSSEREPAAAADAFSHPRRLALQLHTLYALNDILSSWMGELSQGRMVGPRDEPLLDGRQQMFVVRQVEKLSQWFRPGVNDTSFTQQLRQVQGQLSERGEEFKKFVYRGQRPVW